MALTWTKKHRRRAQGLLAKIAEHKGGWEGVAQALGLDDRRIPHNWYRRGSVPLEHVQGLVALAPELKIEPAALCRGFTVVKGAGA